MTQPLKVGIVGYGFATKTFHAPLIHSVCGLELAAISSSNPEKVAADLPEIDVAPSPQALFARPDIDLVVIPTPNATHAPLAAEALAAGKHVVVDKPFTLDAPEARDLLRRAEQAGRVLSVFHNRRWDADFLTVKALIASEQLGRLTHFESHFDRYRPDVPDRWRDSADKGGGLWYDLGSHLLDQSLQLFGPPQTIALDIAHQREKARAVDWFHAVLHYDQLRVILHASALVPAPGPRFVLHGTRGSFVKFGLDPQEDALKTGREPGSPDWGIDSLPGTLTTACSDGLASRILDGEAGDYARYYVGIRDAILTNAPNPVPATEALQVMRLIELGLTSAEEGRTLEVTLLN